MIPLSPLSNYFSEYPVYRQHVKYACIYTQESGRSSEKKKVSLSKFVCLFHEMAPPKKKLKKKRKPAADSSHSLQALLPWRQHKDILFCFASFPILSKGMKTERKLSPRAPTRWTSLCYALRDLWATLQEDLNVFAFLTVSFILGRGKSDIEIWL